METSIKRVESKKELEQAIEDAQAEGWKLKSSSDNVAVLEQSGGLGGALGHIVIFLFTIWWTFGIGNGLYAAYRYFTGKKELRIKLR